MDSGYMYIESRIVCLASFKGNTLTDEYNDDQEGLPHAFCYLYKIRSHVV